VTNAVLDWSLFAKAEFIHMPRTMKLCIVDVPVHTQARAETLAGQRCNTVQALYIAGGGRGAVLLPLLLVKIP